MSKRHYLKVLPDHVAKIIDGSKTTTIRLPRKRPINVGDTIVFQRWVGLPYRPGSTVEPVREVLVTSDRHIVIMRGTLGVYIDAKRMSDDDACEIAQRDGFAALAAMVMYLTDEVNPVFVGQIYGWDA